MELPKTLIEAVRLFSDESICQEYMKRIKWPDGKIVCPKCEGESVSPVKGRPLLQCNNRECKKQFSYKVGTIFEGSPLPLGHWFTAVWCVANCKNGIRSHELARALGVTQKTAWFMLHRIRLAMETESFDKLDGEVESDETYVGGKAKNMHRSRREKAITGRGGVNKSIVQGVLQRGGELRTFVIKNTESETLRGNVLRNVDRRATVYTDAHTSYEALCNSYLHHAVDHSVKYVEGRVHVNGLENFWSLFKRALHGTYTHVAPWHLHRYAAEQTYRFNTRLLKDGVRFVSLLGRVVGRRLSYRELAGVDFCGFMGLS